jgi:hypothetical protein
MANTTFIVADDRDKLMLEKLAHIEEALASLGPLLGKIVAHLEGQAVKPAVALAPYEALYGPIEAGPPEGELVAALQPLAQPAGWWSRLFPARSTP